MDWNNYRLNSRLCHGSKPRLGLGAVLEQVRAHSSIRNGVSANIFMHHIQGTNWRGENRRGDSERGRGGRGGGAVERGEGERGRGGGGAVERGRGE